MTLRPLLTLLVAACSAALASAQPTAPTYAGEVCFAGNTATVNVTANPTATAILIVWALIPPPANSPRLSDILTVVGLIISAVMLLFFLQDWRTFVQTGGTTSYAATTQALIWGGIQLALYTAGFVLALLRSPTRNSLRPLILLLLAGAAAAQIWYQPVVALTSTNAPFWMRLGQLIAFPLWAVMAYLESLHPLLATRARYDAQTDQMALTLRQLAVLQTLPHDQRPTALLPILKTLLPDTDFTALILSAETDDTFSLILPDRQTTLTSAEWPRLQLALDQGEPQRFLPAGVGARDWHTFYASAEIEPSGPLLAQPLVHPATHQAIGLLLVAAHAELPDWSSNAVTLAEALGPMLAVALTDSAEIVHPDHDALVAERDSLRAELLATRARQQQTEKALTTTRREARALSQSLAALEAQLRKGSDS